MGQLLLTKHWQCIQGFAEIDSSSREHKKRKSSKKKRRTEKEEKTEIISREEYIANREKKHLNELKGQEKRKT